MRGAACFPFRQERQEHPMIRKFVNRSLVAAAMAAVPALSAYAAGPDLIASASLPATYEDLSNQTAGPLENGVPGPARRHRVVHHVCGRGYLPDVAGPRPE